MKSFLEKKEKGFFCSAASIVLFAIGLVFYRMLTAVSFETTERPIVVILAAFAAILFSLIASYKDFGKVPSILAYAASTVAFFTLLEGRASYLAFYFAGDVMNTGLSPYMIAAFICFLLAMLAALFAVIFEEDKGGRPKFAAGDWKVVLPMVCVIAILAIVVSLNTNSPKAESSAASASAPAAQSGSAVRTDVSESAPEAAPEAVSNYKTPTEQEEKWQGYTGAQFYQEDNDSKAIAYQLIGHGEVDAGGPTPFDALINLYEDGEMVMTAYGRGNAYQYFGYWTNVNDENLWFCVMDYMVVGMDQICTIDYGYDLTGHFDEFTVNVALGLADGGVFVRNIPAGGDGAVQYPSIRNWLASFGYDMPEKIIIADSSQTAEAESAAEPLPEGVVGHFEGEAFSGAVMMFADLYEDHTIRIYATSGSKDADLAAGIYEGEGLPVITLDKGTAVLQETDTGDLRLIFTADIGSGTVADYELTGRFASEEASAGTPAGEASAAKEVLFSFTSDSENYLLDINTDNTYTFTFKTAGLVEEGTWDYHGWKLTLTDKNGKVTEVDKDNDEHEMRLHFVAAVDERVNRDFTAPSSVWGVAFKGQGDYPAA